MYIQTHSLEVGHYFQILDSQEQKYYIRLQVL
jgi:hypothetical protein